MTDTKVMAALDTRLSELAKRCGSRFEQYTTPQLKTLIETFGSLQQAEDRHDLVRYLFFLIGIRDCIPEVRIPASYSIGKEINRLALTTCLDQKGPDQVLLSKVLGSGRHGIAYAGEIEFTEKQGGSSWSVQVALKFSTLPIADFKHLRTDLGKGRKFAYHKDDKERVWWVPRALKEVFNTVFVNLVINDNYTPHLIYTYGWFICSACTRVSAEPDKIRSFSSSKAARKSPCITYVMEQMDGSVEQLFKDDNAPSYDILQSLFFTVLYTLAVLEKTVGADHNDAGFRNILYLRSPGGNPQAHRRYTIDGQTFYVPDMGMTFFLADYGIMTGDRTFSTSRYSNEVYKTCEPPNQSRKCYVRRDRDGKLALLGAKEQPTNKRFSPYHNEDMRPIVQKAPYILLYETLYYANQLESKDLHSLLDELTTTSDTASPRIPRKIIEDRLKGVAFGSLPRVNYGKLLKEVFRSAYSKVMDGPILGTYSLDIAPKFDLDKAFTDTFECLVKTDFSRK